MFFHEKLRPKILVNFIWMFVDKRMFAIFESLGRQYKVSVGDIIHMDRMSEAGADLTEGTKVVFDQVVMIGGEGNEKLGKPFLAGASIVGSLVENLKGPKIIAFKKKRRHGFHKKRGHRRQISTIKIEEIKAA